MKQDFERNRLKKPLKPLKSCFKLGKKSRLGWPYGILIMDFWISFDWTELRQCIEFQFRKDKKHTELNYAQYKKYV